VCTPTLAMAPGRNKGRVCRASSFQQSSRWGRGGRSWEKEEIQEAPSVLKRSQSESDPSVPQVSYATSPVWSVGQV
jgi:biotin-(acetyl-CoA carboxylase) ligase